MITSDRNLRFWVTVSLLLIGLLACQETTQEPRDTGPPIGAVKNQQVLTYVPADPRAFKPSAVIQKWADDFDDAAIEKQA